MVSAPYTDSYHISSARDDFGRTAVRISDALSRALARLSLFRVISLSVSLVFGSLPLLLSHALR